MEYFDKCQMMNLNCSGFMQEDSLPDSMKCGGPTLYTTDIIPVNLMEPVANSTWLKMPHGHILGLAACSDCYNTMCVFTISQ